LRYTGVGTIYGPYQASKNRLNSQPSFRWDIRYRQAPEFWAVIYPHMSPKRQAQMDAALAKYNARPRRDHHAAAIKSNATRRRWKLAKQEATQLRLIR